MRRHFGIWIFSITVSLYSIIGFSRAGGFDFDFLRSVEKPKIIIFSADWCAPCKSAKTFMQQPENKHLLANFDVEKYNFDVDKTMKKKYNITKVPTFILINNNREVQRYVGIGNNFQGLRKILNVRN